MIEVTNLTKTYGGNTVVKHLNFRIEPGRIYGFLGPNGAGKSTTMNMITGCLAPTEGRILIDGIDILADPIAAKKKIGYLPEIPPVYPDLTPTEYLRFVAEAKGVRRADVFDQVFRVMEETDITDMRDRLIKNLSKGYRQRVGIAQAMLGDPELIILDEPTVGLDPRQIAEIRRMIRHLGETRTVILSSHILAEVSEVCDHVMILSRGRLLASDTLENIRRDNTPENRVVMTVRGKQEEIGATLRTVSGVGEPDVTPGSEPGTFDVTVETEDGTAVIRERLFNAFAQKGMAISRLMKDEPSLEEIFLRMTEADYEEDEDENEDEANGPGAEDGENRIDTTSGDGGDGEEAEEAEEAEEDDYVPLFGGGKKNREDDDS